MPPLLEVKDLHTEFRTGAGLVRAVDGISYTVDPGETVAIVGESGSGKSVSALSILRLIPDPPGRITQGEIRFAGRDIMQLTDAEMREVRGGDIGMVFQEPMTSLNPGTHHPACRSPRHWSSIAAWTAVLRTPGRLNCSVWSASLTRSAGFASTPTNFQAACDSAS